MTMKKLSTGGRARVRGLDVDGNVNIPVGALRPRGRVREGLQCSWREACKAADWDTRQVERRGEGGQRQEDLLFNAEMRLVEAGKRHLIPVLLLIVENGANREESMKRVPKRTYFRHREALLRFFSGTRVHMDI